METTPKSNRLHIALFGKRNSGKSSLINALTGQQVSLVSGVPGTTTDVVSQTMELPGIGACVFIDTAGFDDEGELGDMRVLQTRKAVDKADMALLVCSDIDCAEEAHWIKLLEEKKIPIIVVLNKADSLSDIEAMAHRIEEQCNHRPIIVSALHKYGMDEIRQAILKRMPEELEPQIVGNLANEGDCILLVMPQDGQAPKGRLILPQAQTIRELLDKKCMVVSCTMEGYESALHSLVSPPRLIITDSQVFAKVYAGKPAQSRLTSFSVLFARQKGDIDYYVKSASAIDSLNESSRILIAEACTHAPQSEDIGRVKIPALLRKRIGGQLQIDIVSGSDFPEDLTPYSLVIHCGACMFNRKHVLSRIHCARNQGIPMTNYGVAIAHLTGILKNVEY